MADNENPIQRIHDALRTAFIADALAMPVHWYYNPGDILRAFPGGLTDFQAAPAQHPSSIMSLHSTSGGGRQGRGPRRSTREVVGDVILKGRREFWNKSNCHYHHGMRAGENTLNAYCSRVLMRSLAANNGHYNKESWLHDYIDFMTAEPPRHGDTYAESYHRGFFANLEAGRPADQSGAVTHDTASVGGLVTIAPIVFSERLRGTPVSVVKELCREHLMLTHPDASLGSVCDAYVMLLDELLRAKDQATARAALARCAGDSVGAALLRHVESSRNDYAVIGGAYSPACYISGAWPGILYLAMKYLGNSKDALIANTNLGGDNVHRGFVLGTILGLVDDSAVSAFYDGLLLREELDKELANLTG